MSDDNIVLQEAIKQRWPQADSPKVKRYVNKLWDRSRRVLTAGQDERASRLLHQGRRLLQTWTAKISDPQRRQRFLQNIPSHRAMNAV